MKSWWWLAPVALAALLAGRLFDDAPSEAAARTATAASAPAAPAATAGAASAAPAAGSAPYTAAAAQARQAQLALWQQRLARTQETLEAYRRSTRYPFDSQPIAAHPDQVHPDQPIDETHALRLSGGKAADGLSLRTTQERVFVQGAESVRFAVSLRDESGAAQPLRVVRAWAHDVPPPRTAQAVPDVPMDLNDEGRAGDPTAGDRVYGMQLTPAMQGYAGFFGQIRVEMQLEIRGEQGHAYFDVYYTPEPPAVWQGGVREAMEDGSLSFFLKAEVRRPGRYVISARLDDANGTPFALLGFNDEVASGPYEFKLRLYGRLVRDAKPAFPLTLRDVDGFLLREAFPDRMLMPRRAGPVHTTASIPLAAFSDAEWDSEERRRYVTELTRDVAEAQQRVEQLGGKP